jgi:hypothetical protein
MENIPKNKKGRDVFQSKVFEHVTTEMRKVIEELPEQTDVRLMCDNAWAAIRDHPTFAVKSMNESSKKDLERYVRYHLVMGKGTIDTEISTPPEPDQETALARLSLYIGFCLFYFCD